MTIFLREAHINQLIPVLVINKIDRLHSELGLSPTEAYIRIRELIETINAASAAILITAKQQQQHQPKFKPPQIRQLLFSDVRYHAKTEKVIKWRHTQQHNHDQDQIYEPLFAQLALRNRIAKTLFLFPLYLLES